MGDVLQSIGSTLVGSLSFITEDESGNLLYAHQLTLPVLSQNTADAPEATQQPELPSDAAGGEQGDGEPLQP